MINDFGYKFPISINDSPHYLENASQSLGGSLFDPNGFPDQDSLQNDFQSETDQSSLNGQSPEQAGTLGDDPSVGTSPPSEASAPTLGSAAFRPASLAGPLSNSGLPSGWDPNGDDDPDDDDDQPGFLQIGWRNRKHKRDWSVKNGKAWPKDPITGRDYDVHHKVPLADGGSDTLDNIVPMHPDDHMALHRNNGDFSRWAKRGAAKSSAAVGLLGIVPDITGILSGRIRTDTWLHSLWDMAGYPAPDDVENAAIARCRSMGIYNSDSCA